MSYDHIRKMEAKLNGEAAILLGKERCGPLEQLEIIREFLINNIISDSDKVELDFEESLLETGIIDSLGIVKIITFLKDEFCIEIDNEDVLPENFESIKAIGSFVDRKKRK